MCEILFCSMLAFTSVKEEKFFSDKIVSMHLTLTSEQLNAMTPAAPGLFGAPAKTEELKTEDTHRNTFGTVFPWSKADLTIGEESFSEVGLRYKGNYTYLATARSLKRSLKIDLNRHKPDQKLEGQTMFNLHTGVSDPSKVREAFSYAFFRDVGIVAPRTNFAELTVAIPGKYEKEFVGVYTLTEQVNKVFLAKHFQSGKGMLLKPEGLQAGLSYEGTKWKDYEAKYKPENPPTEKQKQRLIDFTHLILHASDEAFAEKVGTFLDMESFWKFLAANTLLSNLDSFLGFGHNYYLYLHPGTNQFIFIPWDLDLSLATWPAVGTPEQLVDLSIHHPHAGANKLIDRLFAIPAQKAKYLAVLKEMFEKHFTKEKLTARLEAMEKMIAEPLQKETKAVAARKEPAVFGMGQFGGMLPPKKFIEKRIASVEAQLAGKSKGYEPKMFGFGPAPGKQ